MVLARNKKGRFVQRKRSTTRRRAVKMARRRRSHAPRLARRRRRRSNPSMVVVNPRKVGARKARRRSRRLRGVARTVRRRRRAKSHGPRHYRKGMRLRGPRGRSPRRRRRHRTNPSLSSLKSLVPLIKLGVSGALGIVAARQGGAWYDQFLRATVVGDGSSQARVIANDVARIAAMAAVPVLIRRYVLPHVKVIDAQAFLFGGLAEAGRNLVGVGAARLMPSLDRHRWGLDGLVPQGAFAGVVPASAFAGLGAPGYPGTARPLFNGMGAMGAIVPKAMFDGVAAGGDDNNSDC